MQNFTINEFFYSLTPTCFAIVNVIRDFTPQLNWNLKNKINNKYIFVLKSRVQIEVKIMKPM